LALALVLAQGAGCKDEPTEVTEAADAAATEPASSVFEDPGTRARLSWPGTWSRVGAPPEGPDEAVRTLARIERSETNSPVRPRAVLTKEATTLADVELAARRTKNVVEAQLESNGAKVRRVSLSRRVTEGRPLGVVDLTYAVPVKAGDPVEVRHRSLVAHVRGAEGSLAILTLTATYLARDHHFVGPEVDAIFDAFSVPLPAVPPLDRDE